MDSITRQKLEIEVLEQEIKQLKKKITDEVDKVIIVINGIKTQIREKKNILDDKKKVMKKIEGSTVNRTNLLKKFTKFSIKNGIYKAKYYDLNDLQNHVQITCEKKDCSTCLAYYFINNEFGEWESTEMEEWLECYFKLNDNQKQYEQMVNTPFYKIENVSDKLSTVSTNDSFYK